MTRLLLYTTNGCHLCDEALKLLEQLADRREFTLESVDIANHPALVERYGIRIPVVKNQKSNKEIGWPFDIEALEILIGES